MLNPKSKVTTAHVTAEIYYNLRVLGLPAESLQIAYRAKHYKSRYDMLIFKNDKPICILETKNYKRRLGPREDSKQLIKYRSTGLPVIVCVNWRMITQCVEQIMAVYFEAKEFQSVSGRF